MSKFKECLYSYLMREMIDEDNKNLNYLFVLVLNLYCAISVVL